MEIKILQNTDWRFGNYLNDNYVLETTEYDSSFEFIKGIKYFLLDLESNERIEVLPNIEKYNIGEIINVSLNSKYLYFINLIKEDDYSKICVLRYNIFNKETEIVYSFDDNLEGLNETRRLRLFVINDLYLIFQNEFLVLNDSKTYSGFFKFNQKLYNFKDNTEYVIMDENINSNGITDIIPVSENQCVIKTGFSLLEDSRYNMLKKEECSLESISFVNIAQMISDLVIMQNTITLETIDQTFYNKTIAYVKKYGDYIIYSCVNNETKEEEVKFYNIVTNETRTCINQNVVRVSNLAKSFILNNEPYICIVKDKEISFLNLTTNKIERKYNKGLKLCKIFNNMLIFIGINNSVFSKKKKTYFDIISFPQSKLLLHEHSEYVDSLVTNNEIIYVIVK